MRSETHLRWRSGRGGAYSRPSVILMCCALLITLLSHPASAADWPWSEAVEVSRPSSAPNGSFPDLVADLEGRLHIVWYSALQDSGGPIPTILDTASYRSLSGSTWSDELQLFAPADGTPLMEHNGQIGGLADVTDSKRIIHAAMAASRDGNVHFLFGRQDRLLYGSTFADAITAAALAGELREIGQGTFNTIASGHDGALHVTFAAALPPEQEASSEGCEPCARIVYRRSLDGGVNWSSPLSISFLAGTGGQQQLRVDDQGHPHLVWDQVLQEPGQHEGIRRVIYRRSSDRGESWQAPVVLGPSAEGVSQGALGLTPDGNPAIVYRSATGPRLYFQHSRDGGASWSLPGLIPGVFGRAIEGSDVDSYSLASDSAGRLHLLMVGSVPGDPEGEAKLLHLTWDGQWWTTPRVVMGGPLLPEAPRLTVERGNRLHAVWFTREGLSGPAASRQSIWYSSAQIDAPALAPLPQFTPVPRLGAAPTTPMPEPSPTPLTPSSRSRAVPSGPPSWEGRALGILTLALAPMFILIVFVGWRSLARRYDEEN